MISCTRRYGGMSRGPFIVITVTSSSLAIELSLCKIPRKLRQYKHKVCQFVEIKCQLDATEVLLQILLLAQHVTGITMPIIRSSRVLYSGCCVWYFVLWFFK